MKITASLEPGGTRAILPFIEKHPIALVIGELNGPTGPDHRFNLTLTEAEKLCDTLMAATLALRREMGIVCEHKVVRIEVRGGVAEVVSCPDGVLVDIVDHDNEAAGETDDVLSNVVPATQHCRCGVEVDIQAPYWSTPCGTFCEDCFRAHSETCEVCRREFEL